MEPDNQALATLFKNARELRGQHQYEVCEAVGISPGFLSSLERAGYFPGMRALELLKLAKYYGLDVLEVSHLLGVEFPRNSVGPRGPLSAYIDAATTLPIEDQEWLAGILDALLRGLRTT